MFYSYIQYRFIAVAYRDKFTKGPAIHARSKRFAVMEPDEAASRGIETCANSASMPGNIHICGYTTYTPRSFLLIDCTRRRCVCIRVHVVPMERQSAL